MVIENDWISYFKITKLNLDIEIENFDISSLPEAQRKIVEADSYWTTSYLLEGIQDNYTFAQPGIQYKVRTLEELVKRIDGLLTKFFIWIYCFFFLSRTSISSFQKSTYRIFTICFSLDE
jgi:hypothetical protein